MRRYGRAAVPAKIVALRAAGGTSEAPVAVGSMAGRASEAPVAVGSVGQAIGRTAGAAGPVASAAPAAPPELFAKAELVELRATGGTSQVSVIKRTGTAGAVRVSGCRREGRRRGLIR